MTIQIEETEEFAEKLAHVLGAVDKLKRAGTHTSPELFEHMLDEFLAQYTIATPAPAPIISVGWVVTSLPLHTVPFDFKGKIYDSKSDAQLAVTKFIGHKGYGRTGDYEIKEVSYFG